MPYLLCSTCGDCSIRVLTDCSIWVLTDRSIRVFHWLFYHLNLAIQFGKEKGSCAHPHCHSYCRVMCMYLCWFCPCSSNTLAWALLVTGNFSGDFLKPSSAHHCTMYSKTLMWFLHWLHTHLKGLIVSTYLILEPILMSVFLVVQVQFQSMKLQYPIKKRILQKMWLANKN